jgi:hypothetical protein
LVMTISCSSGSRFQIAAGDDLMSRTVINFILYLASNVLQLSRSCQHGARTARKSGDGGRQTGERQTGGKQTASTGRRRRSARADTRDRSGNPAAAGLQRRARPRPPRVLRARLKGRPSTGCAGAPQAGSRAGGDVP